MNAAAPDPRMAGLDEDGVRHLQAAARAIRDNAPAQAERQIEAALAAHPEHPEALRLLGILRNRQGRFDEAADALQRTLQVRSDDAFALCDLGTALRGLGRAPQAFEAWRRACTLAPDFPLAWFNLGRNLQRDGVTAEAAQALQRAVELAPTMLPAHVLLGDALVHLGRFDEADARYRSALALHPACGDAWRGLANMKTRALGEDDAAALRAALARPRLAPADRIAMGFALGKLHEDHERPRQAFDAIADANTAMRRMARWDAAGFRAHVDAVARASAGVRPAPADARGRGREAIFIVGMPRSGSTLFEQILAAHPEVEGASELPDLHAVLGEESKRRGAPFPAWVGDAGADDWRRLGEDYLARTAGWRGKRPRHTDKMPENWLYAGVLRAMLPGAVVIDVRRDPLEAGWSCFKQQFYRLPHFSNDLADIAAYTLDYVRTMDAWRAAEPQRIVLQRYEDLLAAPERQVRALLEACGLPFHADCLDFHRARRSVRTASAAQVRQPLHRDTARADRYGTRLDPLRAGLGLPAFADAG